ncbi:hypothetical protein [Jongsikchunia kroppenstedtii]|uniref:hypothetical protein n=1 Tax=Jongsikchunia kroppenstedtii TaxID=1121721 RepID=UPI001FE14601|nr:hypothetical protein [Jongsikchunia kroppenstedtii]
MAIVSPCSRDASTGSKHSPPAGYEKNSGSGRTCQQCRHDAVGPVLVHITHEATREDVQKRYDVATVKPDEIANIIGFVLAQPRHLAINEILIRPADQLN